MTAAPKMTEVDREHVARQVLDAAFRIHTRLGAGLLESAYHACLCYELSANSFTFRQQVSLPVKYERVQLDVGYRVDFLIENCLIVELKSVEKLLPVHTAQVLTYLKLSGISLALLINFNVPHLKQGIRRIVHDRASGV